MEARYLEKENASLNLIKQLDDDYSIIDESYLYAEDPKELKYQYLVKICESNGLENMNGPRAIENSNNMQDVYKIIEEYNLHPHFNSIKKNAIYK